jgi:hypothetical protein
MDILVTLKALIAGASAASLIAMAFMAITPATWFIAFTGVSLTWLYQRKIMVNRECREHEDN